MKFQVGKCPKCGLNNELIISNNPLAPPICFHCVEQVVKNPESIEHVNFLCRTYNIAFDPDKWLKIIKSVSIQSSTTTKILKLYLQQYQNTNKKDMIYKDINHDLWQEVSKEWQKVQTYTDLLLKIEPIKDNFIERGHIKWGAQYSFAELIQLEQMYSSSMETFDINQPIQVDALKKVCKVSVKVDQALLVGDSKEYKDYMGAYAQVTKLAKVDEMIESSQSDIIRTISDLANHVEQSGFKLKFYDGANRDIVDKTIHIMKDHLRTLVLESTGLDTTLDMIKAGYERAEFSDADGKAFNELPIEKMVEKTKDMVREDIDNELSGEVAEYDEDDF